MSTKKRSTETKVNETINDLNRAAHGAREKQDQPTATEVAKHRPTLSVEKIIWALIILTISAGVFFLGMLAEQIISEINAKDSKQHPIPAHMVFGFSYTNNVPKGHILQTTDSGLFRCVTEEDLKWESITPRLKTRYWDDGAKWQMSYGGVLGFETRQEAIAAAWKHIGWLAEFSARNERDNVHLRYAQGDEFKNLVDNEQLHQSLMVTSNGVLRHSIEIGDKNYRKLKSPNEVLRLHDGTEFIYTNTSNNIIISR